MALPSDLSIIETADRWLIYGIPILIDVPVNYESYSSDTIYSVFQVLKMWNGKININKSVCVVFLFFKIFYKISYFLEI